ncbi:hypothetical protein DPMN_091306 [Dreissena polymorpha]|uniref:Uncharacterized protein n=2 Tax=Dreissena polymorpha TaxID=45954 RepID=A0A9D4L1U6_DREPO|nr:hypothetical protein DPMN_091306 [Dreissena polymorpha]
MTTKNEMTLFFNPDTTILQTLSNLSGLGQIHSKGKRLQTTKSTTQNTEIRQKTVYSQQQLSSDVKQQSVICHPNQVIRVKSSQKYTVNMKNDSETCFILGICETATGELLIIDGKNCKVKLLDQTYKVVDHYDIKPIDMCSIDSSLVAITVNGGCEVHFLQVTNGQLIWDRKLELQHYCLGIAHHQGNLYITDGKALYHYTVDGRLVSKMYEDTSAIMTVTSCALSPDGARIYVANVTSMQLVTLSREGKVISTLTDPALYWKEVIHELLFLVCGIYEYIPVIHVTDLGQVLVCGNSTIIQVDKDGRQRLAEVVTARDGVTSSKSVYYSKHRSALIVGMVKDDDIMVFQTL